MIIWVYKNEWIIELLCRITDPILSGLMIWLLQCLLRPYCIIKYLCCDRETQTEGKNESRERGFVCFAQNLHKTTNPFGLHYQFSIKILTQRLPFSATRTSTPNEFLIRSINLAIVCVDKGFFFGLQLRKTSTKE